MFLHSYRLQKIHFSIRLHTIFSFYLQYEINPFLCFVMISGYTLNLHFPFRCHLLQIFCFLFFILNFAFLYVSVSKLLQFVCCCFKFIEFFHFFFISFLLDYEVDDENILFYGLNNLFFIIVVYGVCVCVCGCICASVYKL